MEAFEGLVGEYPLKALQWPWIRWPLGIALLLWLGAKLTYRMARFTTVTISSAIVYFRDPERPLPVRITDDARDYKDIAAETESERKMFGHQPLTQQQVPLYWHEVDDETDLGRAGKYPDTVLTRPRSFLGGGWHTARWWAIWFILFSSKSEFAPLMCYAREFFSVLLAITGIAALATVFALVLLGHVHWMWLGLTIVACAVGWWGRRRHVRRAYPYGEEYWRTGSRERLFERVFDDDADDGETS